MQNTNLKILRIQEVGLTPSFNPNVKEYYFVTENLNALPITAIPENENAKVVIEGNKNLQMGRNVITISVTSQDESMQSQYLIHVTKTESIAKANTNLETLAVAQGTLVPEFDNLITEYQVEVENETESMNILAIPQSENAKVTVEMEEKLKVGDNKIVVTVFAEDKITQKQYHINVHRNSTQEQTLSEQQQAYNAKRVEAIIEQNSSKAYQPINTGYSKPLAFACIVLLVLLIIGSIIWKRKKK